MALVDPFRTSAPAARLPRKLGGDDLAYGVLGGQALCAVPQTNPFVETHGRVSQRSLAVGGVRAGSVTTGISGTSIRCWDFQYLKSHLNLAS